MSGEWQVLDRLRRAAKQAVIAANELRELGVPGANALLTDACRLATDLGYFEVALRRAAAETERIASSPSKEQP